MVSTEISLSTELGEEKLLAQVRSWVGRWIKKGFPQNYPNRELEMNYRRQAEFWTTQIEPTAGLSVRIAALTHDISCAEEDQKNLSARIVGRSLGGLRLPREFIRNTARLVQDYETGEDFMSMLVRDTASIAFLEVKAPFLISSAPEEGTFQEIRDKINLMYNRIQIARAREIAEEFYGKAMTLLEEKRPEEGRLEEERRRARAEYCRLVEEHKRKHSATEEEIDKLREAGDKVLSLG